MDQNLKKKYENEFKLKINDLKFHINTKLIQ